MKVYCDDCHWFNKSLQFRNFENLFKCRKELFVVNYWDSRKNAYSKHPSDKNRNNDCEDYKPRLWKRIKNILGVR
ncbi:hypothetical protein ES702_07707 [subsurface metagenome]